jgi:hypothetical protein
MPEDKARKEDEVRSEDLVPEKPALDPKSEAPKPKRKRWVEIKRKREPEPEPEPEWASVPGGGEFKLTPDGRRVRVSEPQREMQRRRRG